MSVSSCSTTAWPAPARVEVAAHGDDAADAGATAAHRIHHLVAAGDLARRDRAGEAAEVLARAHHHLHGEAEAAAARASGALWRPGTCCRWSSSGGPAYQGMASERRATLSPSTAETGNGRRVAEGEAVAPAPGTRASMARKRSSDQSTRSILLTARTTLPTPIRSRMAAWRRVCTFTPLRASTSRMATSAWRGAGGHVARVLLVAGAVDDDEAAPGRRLRCRSSARRCRW